MNLYPDAPRRRRGLLLALTALTALSGALVAHPAWAHDTLIASSPENGDTLDTAPEEVVLTFNNSPMEGDGNAVVVTGPDGESTYEEGPLSHAGADVTVSLRPLDTAGEYTINYRIVSSDGHPIQDSLVFSVTEEAVAAAVPAEEEQDPAEPADDPAPESPAPEVQPLPDPAAPFGPVVGVIAALAGAGAILILIVRLRNRRGGGTGPDGERD